jgi:hypothetical protein
MNKMIALMTLVLMSCQPSVHILGVNVKTQSTNKWCWAATTAMVYEYYTGKETKDCDIANVYYESKDKDKCCTNNGRCNRSIPLAHLVYLLQDQLKLSADYREGGLGFDEIVDEISNNRLVVMGVVSNNNINLTVDHVALVVGYEKEGQYLYVIDPNIGEIAVPYEKFMVEKPVGSWIWTIVVGKNKDEVSQADSWWLFFAAASSI